MIALRPTKELFACLVAIAAAALTMLSSARGGASAARPLPRVPPVEPPAEVGPGDVEIARPRLVAADRAFLEGRDFFAAADIWEDARPVPLPLPPEARRSRIVPAVTIGGGRAAAARPPRIPALPVPLEEEGEGETETDGAAAGGKGAPGGPGDGAAEADGIVLFDRVYLKGGVDPIEGTIVGETAEGVQIQRRGSTSTFVIARSDIERIVRADVPARVYEERARKLTADDVDGRLALARFCAKHDLATQAAKEAMLAARAAGAAPERREKAVEAYRLLVEVIRARREKAVDFRADLADRELEAYTRAEAQGALAPDLRLGKARLLASIGDGPGALLELEKVTGDEAADGALRAAARLELGDLALALSEREKAERAYAALAEGESGADAARALEGLGLAIFARGDLAAAIEAFDRAAAAAPDRAEPLVARGIAAFHAGDLDAAEAAFAKAREKKAETAELLLYEGLLAALRGKLGPASEKLAKAAAASGAALGTSGGSAPGAIAVEALLGEGFCLEIAGRSGEALEKYAAARKLALAATGPDPAARATAALAGLAALIQAQALAARGEAPLAEEALRQAARLGYDFPTVAAEIARMRREARDHATAIRFARYAEARRPRDPDILCGLGLSYLGAGALDEAEAAFEGALALAPAHHGATVGKARLLYERGDFEGAERLFQAAVALEPEDGYASLGLRRIAEARARRVWRDDFRRPDGKDVRNRWVESERFGIEAVVRGQTLALSGKQASEDMGITQVVREVEGAHLAEFRVRLDAAGAGAARAGIRLASRDGEIVFFRSPEGTLEYAMRAAGKDVWTEPARAGAWPREVGPHELWLAIGGPDRGEVVFGADHEELARAKVAGLGKARAFSCGIYVQAPIGAPVDLVVQEARVYIVREPGKAAKAGGY